MHPVVCKTLTVCPFALSNFIFVVRENQVRPTAVDIKCFTQIVATHRRALNVPTRAALTPGAIPLWLSGFGALPQHKIKRITLGIVSRHTLAADQIINRFAGEFAVIFKLTNGIGHVTAFCLIGQSLLLQLFNDVEHLRDEMRGARLNGRRQAAESDHVFLHGLCELIG